MPKIVKLSDPKCVACGDTGKSSSGGICHPCAVNGRTGPLLQESCEGSGDQISSGSDSEEKLGINLWDMDRLAPAIRGAVAKLLRTDKENIVRLDEVDDEDAQGDTLIQFECNLLSAAIILDIVRSHDRQVGDHATRTYLLKSGRWVRLPPGVALTLVDNSGKCVLNPRWFNSAQVRAKPLAVRRI